MVMVHYGATLLMLSELDLTGSSVANQVFRRYKSLVEHIRLRNSHINSSQPSPRISESASQHDDVLLCVEYDQRRKMSISGEDVFVRTKQSAIIEDPLVDSISDGGEIRSVRLISRDELIRTVESPDTKSKSLAKLLIAFFYCLSSLLITAFVMVLVHDRVPVYLATQDFRSMQMIMEKLLQITYVLDPRNVDTAFYISSRMFLYYHAYAYNHANLTATDDRIRLWFPLGWFFEAGSIGKVPNEFEMPLRVIIPRWWDNSRRHDEKEEREEHKHEKEAKHSKKLKKKNH
ncbi:hypothetical protein OSTOST_25902 [Ostertagia ostertagi]